MSRTREIAIRELDHRTNDGIDVRLLWDSRMNRVFVALDDERTGEGFDFEVDGADALDGFRHPYVYANRECHNRSAGSRTVMGEPQPQIGDIRREER